MKKVIVVGNSHAAVLANMWDHGNNKIGIAKATENIYACWQIPWGSWGIKNKDIDPVFDKIKNLLDDETIVLFFLGSSDIRNNLVKYKNVEEVVEAYVSVVEGYFSSLPGKVGFIDPVPTTNDSVFLNNEEYLKSFGGYGTPAEMAIQYNLFKKALKIKSKIHLSIDRIVGGTSIRKTHSDDGCHLNINKNAELLRLLQKRFIS